ncbi:sodium/hydrogen exchanger 7-like [Pomacea canaliculata]|uniref:sodium/hydrogen exchanger 7-like n=1 Tax=Pomacea canaliculata TaxID=400727 RepID=UPI000D72F53C|nr:sodium/hydrogen exchanger 7-like [Pomacea canaliculata]
MTVTTTSADVTAATTDNITTDSFNFSQTNATTQRSEDHENSNYILVIFGGFVIGALVRQVLGSARVPLPHTAILQALGVVAAWVATRWPVLMHVVDLRELELGALVHLFLPLLLFQPAFNAELHVLRVTFNQIVVLAFGAFLITAGVTLVLVLWVLNYDWPLRVVCVFCTVLAITDPSVQDFVTRCTGTSDETSGMLLGESLVTPIAAILVNKFVSFAVPEDVYTGSVLVGDLGYMLLTPLLAVLIAKVTAAWLQRIFNDAIMEITVVIVAVHLSSLVCNLFGVPGFW